MLTRQQKKIILLTCDGKTNRQIGKILFIEEKTVMNHKYQIMRKLEARSTSQVIAICFRTHLIE
jgi:DNA-binding CsgD family transcriptional regulator